MARPILAKRAFTSTLVLMAARNSRSGSGCVWSLGGHLKIFHRRVVTVLAGMMFFELFPVIGGPS